MVWIEKNQRLNVKNANIFDFWVDKNIFYNYTNFKEIII